MRKLGNPYTKYPNMANSRIKYAPEVQAKDKTYMEVTMNLHILSEAYFLRGLCLLLIWFVTL